MVTRRRCRPRSNRRSWSQSHDYLLGCDLFNHGYYWEAHETWEGLWNACGRSGTTADFLKGLIKLAAAGVKAAKDVPRESCGTQPGHDNYLIGCAAKPPRRATWGSISIG